MSLLLRLGKAMNRHGLRGGYRLLAFCRNQHLLPETVIYTLPNGGKLVLPIRRPENCWDLRDVLNYEAAYVSAFSRHTRRDTVLFDVGADIGTFATLVCDHVSGRLGRVLAYEPNVRAFDILCQNVGRLPNGLAFNYAVADFMGTGLLEYPHDDPESEHACFLSPGDGAVKVITLDASGLRPESVAIKIDVEGGELAVIRGACQTITSAKHCVVGFEAHPLVCARTGISLERCISYLRTLRPFSIQVIEAETSNVQNVIAVSI